MRGARNLCTGSYLDCLEHRLETFKVPSRGVEERLNYRGRKCCVAYLQVVCDEGKYYVFPWTEREVAAKDVRGRIGELEGTEASIGHTEVGNRVTPTA